MMRRKRKKWSEMTTDELREATKEFDKEFVVDTFRPLTKKDIQLHEQAHRRGGRPKIGKGAKIVAISVERDRLKRIDAYAKAHGMSRSELLLSATETLISKDRK